MERTRADTMSDEERRAFLQRQDSMMQLGSPKPNGPKKAKEPQALHASSNYLAAPSGGSKRSSLYEVLVNALSPRPAGKALGGIDAVNRLKRRGGVPTWSLHRLLLILAGLACFGAVVALTYVLCAKEKGWPKGIEKGDTVRLKKLQRVEYNNWCGDVEDYNHETHQFTVKLRGSGALVAVKTRSVDKIPEKFYWVDFPPGTLGIVVIHDQFPGLYGIEGKDAIVARFSHLAKHHIVEKEVCIGSRVVAIQSKAEGHQHRCDLRGMKNLSGVKILRREREYGPFRVQFEIPSDTYAKLVETHFVNRAIKPRETPVVLLSQVHSHSHAKGEVCHSMEPTEWTDESMPEAEGHHLEL